MKTIIHSELKTKLENGEDFVLLNVLSRENYEKAHIPQSLNVPHDTAGLVEKVEEIAGSKDAEIVVYCASTDCPASEKVAARLEEAGFTDVTDFEGGMKAWQEAGFDTEGTQTQKRAA